MQDQTKHRAGNPERAPDPETDQFKYDTPYDGGSVSDRAGINAAKEGKLVADKNDVEQAKEEVKDEKQERPN